MLQLFGFERLGVVLSDLYFLDAAPLPDQHGAERGVRLELRVLERQALEGSEDSAQPVRIGQPIWRADLLESVGAPGSSDRTHDHPRFDGWEPGERVFDADLSADPLGWLAARLSALEDLLERAEMASERTGGLDAKALAHAALDIVAAASRTLRKVRAGELAEPPAVEPTVTTRLGWL
jgi:hypothetical protein